MTATRGTLPTLTEVIEIAAEDPAATAPLPLAPDSMPLDPTPPIAPPAPAAVPRLSLLGPEEAARIVDAVMARMQPRLEAWVRTQLADTLREALQPAVDAAAAEVARRLRSELPALARAALDEVRPDNFES